MAKTLENNLIMQETITISISSEVHSALDDVAIEEGMSSDDLINEAIKEYLFFHKLRLLREKLAVKARKQGISTEQDVSNIDILGPSEFLDYKNGIHI